jgi:excinuclease UvrABC nuclease subunit
MSFPTVYYDFNADSITRYAPPASGVYLLLNQQRTICVGTAINLRDTLLTHLKKPSPCLMRWQPLAFQCEPMSQSSAANQRNLLILQRQPVCSEK